MDAKDSVSSRTRRKTDSYILSMLAGYSSSGGSGSSHGQKKRGRGMREKVEPFLGSEGTDSGARASSSLSRSKGTKRSSGGGLKSEREVNDDFVCLGESIDERECGEQRRDSFVMPPPKEVIDLVDSDDNDTDNGNGNDYGNAVNEGVKPSENLGFEDAVDVDMGDAEEEKRGSYVSTDEGKSFVDEEHGLRPENPITIDFCGDCESNEGGSEDDDQSGLEFHFGSSSDTTDYGESSDEDFQADDIRDGWSSEDDSSSYVDEDENEKQRIRNYKCSGPRAKKISRFDEGASSFSMDHGRKVETENSASCNKNGESSASLKKKDKLGKEGELDDAPSSTRNDECDEQDQNLWKTKGCCSTKLDEVKRKKVAKKSDAKRVDRTGENGVADVESFGDSHYPFHCTKPCEDEVEKDKEKQNGWNGHQKKDSLSKIDERMENGKEKRENMESRKDREVTAEHKDWINSKNHEGKAWFNSQTSYRDRECDDQRNPSRLKEVHLIELLSECFLRKHNTIRNGWRWLQEKDDDDVYRRGTRLPIQTLPSNLTFGVKKEPLVEKTKSEKELEELWEEMEMLLRLGEVDSLVGSAWTTEAGQNRESPASLCKHNFSLDEQIGIYCKRCHFIETHIKDITPPFVEECPNSGLRKRSSSDGVDVSPFDEDQIKASDVGSKDACPHHEGTVWDLIPNVKQNMYAHQQEGFEFIWTNLAGTMDLGMLKSADPTSAGGCIISHAPGTGKTKLTIVFLQTYLEVFPECHPVIVAPASLLLNWEDEFKKWDIGIPFHNLNNPDLSGKEHVAALKKLDCFPNPNKNKDNIRMVKLYSWFKDKSILGISYNLYEQIVGDYSSVENATHKKKMNEKKYKSHENKTEKAATKVMGDILHDIPDLLVLDEGHTPRNHRSHIWKVLSKVPTPKRIILSGTPFQNNFLELYNTLCIVKPSFPDKLPHELKKFCQSKLSKEKKASKGVTWEPVSSAGKTTDEKICQLKLLMDPFVHVHKGNILQKNLPGLRECVVTLMPDNMQKELLESIEHSQNTLNFEHKLALVSAHPSLFLNCSSLTEKEESVVDRDHLEGLRLNPYVGVKTKFLVEFLRLCEAVNEKVIVFSQFVHPLFLIRDQLKSVFNWCEGKEMSCMIGSQDKKQKQLMIHRFNDAYSQAKILLASTKSCSEGINLVGASRVVLLDVVWNPSVERQAISRAYRLGQKKVVYTYHLMTHGTTEYEKFRLQAKKDQLSKLVFSSRNTEDDKPKSSDAVFEDEILDHMVRHPKLKDLFGDCASQPKKT